MATLNIDITMDKSEVGLGNVDNTSDANKPVSTLQAAADAATLASANAYSDSLVIGLWDDRGNFDASVNAYPSTGGSGSAGAIKKGDTWTISVAGTLPTGQVVEIGDVVRALTDTPGNAQANWAIQQNNIGYTAENSANKSTDVATDQASNVKYPTVKAVYDWVVALIANFISIASPAQGDTIYYNGSSWVKLAKGTALQVLRMNAGETAPEWAAASGGNNADSIAMTLDGQGFVLNTGTYGTFVAPWSGIITGWYLVEASQVPISSSIVIDVWKVAFASYPPAVGNTIFGTKPALSGATSNSATGLSIAVTAGDVFRWNIDSVTSAKLVQLVLLVTKS